MRRFSQGKRELEIAPNVTRALLLSSEQYTLTKLHLSRKAESSLHAHPHVQLVFLLAGKGLFRLGDDNFVLKSGDCLHVPGNVPHGFVKIVRTISMLEFFIPARKDIVDFHSRKDDEAP